MKTIQDVFEVARVGLAGLVVFTLSGTMLFEIHAEPPLFEWVRTAGGFGTDGAQAVATDSAGGVYLVGNFQGQATFGSNVVGTLLGLRSQAFISKLDGRGNFVWIDTSQGTEDSIERFYVARSIAAGAGSVYVSGLFNGVARFGTTTLDGVNGRYVFVVRSSPDGSAMWSRRIGGFGRRYATEYLQSGIALSGDGTIYVTGAFESRGDFGSTNIESIGALDGFLTKLDSEGNLLWAKRFGGYWDDFGYAVAADASGNCWAVVSFTGPARFGAVLLDGHPLNSASGTRNQLSVGVVKCDPAGNVFWARQESSGIETPYWGSSKMSIAVDASGNGFVSGWVVGRPSGEGGDLVNPTMFLAKYNPEGIRLWTKRIGDGQISHFDGDFSANAVAVDDGGNCYVAGYFRRTAQFGSIILVSSGDRDIFVAKYDPEGSPVWVKQAGLTFEDQASGLALDKDGNLYVAGSFFDVATFDGADVDGDLSDAFIAKLRPQDPIPPSILLDPTNQTVSAGETARFTVLAGGAPPFSYQWRFNGLEIPGAVATVYTLSNVVQANAGSYSVVISNSYGSITSSVATLTVDFLLTIKVKSGGFVSRIPDRPSYTPGSEVNVTAVPDVGARFVSWLGDLRSADNPLKLTMNSNIVLIADFAKPRLTPLGNLPGEGGPFDSEANAISADGSTVVGFTSTAGSYHAFRWTESTGIADLGSLPGGESHARFANAVSGDGSVVVGYSRYDDNRTDQAFRWTSSEGMLGIGFFPGRATSFAWGISADGNVIVGSGESSQGGLAFRWTASEGIRGLGTVTGSDFRSIAYSASSNGTLVVGGNNTTGNSDAVIWTAAGGTIKLGHVSNGIAAVAWDISSDGRYVVGVDGLNTSTSNAEAFRWSSSGGFKTLGHIAGQPQHLSGLSISADGEVIVGTEGDEAFIWTPGLGMRRLWDALISVGVNPAADGWTQLSGARGVSDDGRFVCGFGQRDGRRQAYRADLLPAAVPLTVLTNGKGSVVRSPEQPNYPANSTVSLTAVPGPGSYFVNWSGDATGALNPITVAMTRRKSVTANFANTRLTLIPQGSGTISKSPDRGYYDLGEEVMLTALPGPWHVFTRWGDGVTTNPRVITIRPNNTYAAVFSPTTTVETLTFNNVSRTAPVGMPSLFVDDQFVITNAVSRLDAATVSMRTTFPNGAIFYTLDGTTPDFGANLYDGPFVLNRSATIRVVAYDPTFRSSWEADPLEVTVEPTFVLNATTAGGGIVSVTPNLASYGSNTVVTVVAMPAPGWSFLQWLGDADGTNATAAVRVLSRDLCVQALFGRPLGTTVVGGGSVVIDPAAPLYPYGTVVRLTAVPEEGNYFGAWGNAVISTNNPLLMTMTNANPSVSCVFGPLNAGQVALTVLVKGQGSVTTTPRGHRFPAGQSVRLSAVADVDQEFLGWTGDANATSTNVTIALTQSKVVTAHFTKRPRLSVGPCLGGWNEDGFQLTVTGEFGGRFSVEHSDNLEDWQSFGSFTNTFGIWQMTDRSDTNGARRFFRATGQP